MFRKGDFDALQEESVLNEVTPKSPYYFVQDLKDNSTAKTVFCNSKESRFLVVQNFKIIRII